MNIRCPRCESDLSAVVNRHDGVTCPSCGFQLDLVSAETISHEPGRPGVEGLPTESQANENTPNVAAPPAESTHSSPVFTESPISSLQSLGDYDLLEILGQGGMGVVYRARQRSANRIVALKVIRADRLAGASPESRRDALARFMREAQLTAQLDHEHLVTVYEVGQIDGCPFYSMKYVEGQSLHDLLRERLLESRRAARYLESAARGVDEAHQHGILHRDLKPHNVLIDSKTDRALVADFGLAKLAEAEGGLSISGEVFGTPSYMSPEQAVDSTRVTILSDVYSLGATLYHALTGRPPFQAATALETLKQVVSQEPVPPRQLNLGVNRDLETICLKAISKEPSQRYTSAGAFADDLKRWLDGLPIVARPIGRAARGWRWCKRRPAVAGLAAAVMLTMATGTIVSGYFAIQASHRASEAIAAERRAKGESARAEANAQQARAGENYASQLAYNSDMNLAQRAWDDGRFDDVLELVKRQEPKPGEMDLRGWEWCYQNRISHGELRTLTGHTNSVNKVCFSPNRRLVASAGSDATIKLWDIESGAEQCTLRGHNGPVQSVCFSPDGMRLVSGGQHGTIRLWDVKTGVALRTMVEEEFQTVTDLCFSPDGRRIAANVDGGTIKVWDVDGTAVLPTLKLHGGAKDIRFITFTPDGRRLIAGGKVWDAQNGAELRTITVAGGTLQCVSPNGRYLASNGVKITLGDVETGAELHTLRGHVHGVLSLAVSPDGSRLVSSGGDKELKLWDAKVGVEMRTLCGLASFVHTMCFSPEGGLIASGSEDGTIALWDVERDNNVFTITGQNEEVEDIAFSANGQELICTGKHIFKRLHTESWTVLRTFKPASETDGLWFSQDCRWLASIDREDRLDNAIKLLDAQSGAELRKLKGRNLRIDNVVFSTEGCRVAAVCPDKVVLWDAETGAELLTITIQPPSKTAELGGVDSVCFSPDGGRLATTYLDSAYNFAVKLWDVNAGTELRTLTGHTQAVRRVCFSPDGHRIASAASDATIKLWDAQTGAELRTLRGHTDIVEGVSFSPDGQRIASTSRDRTIRVWDAESGAELRTLRGHTATINCGRFSPDGWQLASAGADNTIKIWDARNFTQDEKMGRFLAREMVKHHADKESTLAEVRGKPNWNDAMRKAANEYIEAAFLP